MVFSLFLELPFTMILIFFKTVGSNGYITTAKEKDGKNDNNRIFSTDR
jgi:hypothetical protein